jgi:hypothetical protein
LKYRYDSQQNRSRLRRLAHYGLVGSINPFVPEFSNLTEEKRLDSKSGFAKDDRVSVTDASTLTPDFYSDQQTSLLVSDRSMDPENNTFESTTSAVLYNDVVTTSPSTHRNDSRIVDLEEPRNLPSDTMIREMQNRAARHTTIDDGNELSLWREPRARRLQRDQGRGKKRRKNRRRPNRSRRRLGISVVSFLAWIYERIFLDPLGRDLKTERSIVSTVLRARLISFDSWLKFRIINIELFTFNSPCISNRTSVMNYASVLHMQFAFEKKVSSFQVR